MIQNCEHLLTRPCLQAVPRCSELECFDHPKEGESLRFLNVDPAADVILNGHRASQNLASCETTGDRGLRGRAPCTDWSSGPSCLSPLARFLNLLARVEGLRIHLLP